MNLIFLGTDYRQSSIKELEQLVLSPDQIRKFILELPPDSPLKEIVILSTCNRIEFYVTASAVSSTVDWLQAYLADFLSVDITLTKTMIFKDGLDAISHLLKVTSGTESMVFGEGEILSQVKEAYSLAQSIPSTGAVLNKIFQSAIATGKRVRAETGIGRGSYSISSIAIESIRQEYRNYKDKSILVIGAGTMARRVVRKLFALGHEKIYVSNRSESKLDDLRDRYGASSISYSQWMSRLVSVNIALFATSAPNYLLSAQDIKNTGQLEMIIDLGLPRNVDPRINQHPIKRIALKELEKVACKTVSSRNHELPKIKYIIADEIAKLQQWLEFAQSPCLLNCA